jgi:predicted GIY-YIG superfamily endonuclease
MYTIYHIPERNKVGCTKNLQRRMKELKAVEFKILEVHSSRSEATKREIQL